MDKTVTIPLKTAQDLLGLAVMAADGRKHARVVNTLRDAIRTAQAAPAATPTAPLFQDQ